MSAYNPQELEKKWQKYWKENQTFKTHNPLSGGEGAGDRLPKFFALDMFPYPSGAGLHVGHPLGYIATDIVSRYKRLKGFNVLHPMGFDSFGLPAEQYAIQTGQHPAITTEQNINRYRQQLDNLGFSYDWGREVKTSNEGYYKWTQWIFIQIFNSWYNKETDKAESIDLLIEKFEKSGNKDIKAVCDEDTLSFTAEEWENFSDEEQHAITLKYRLAYLANTFVNWCPGLGTVLANEEVKDGVSERGGFPVIRKEMPQWQLRITAYAERLINDLDLIDWPEPIKEQQRNWIGKSKGCMVSFKAPQPSKGEPEWAVSVFTTRVDTLFGVTYLTLAPEHELIDKITTPEQAEAVAKYVYYAKNRSERDRQSDVKTISGEFTGTYAINPFNNEKIPIWIGEYVLAGYGTGAVMAVPSSDIRDYNFAKHFNLPIIQVQEGEYTDISKEDFNPKAGTMINSGFLNGLNVKEAIDAAIKKVEELGVGYGKVNFRIRDSIFSRQRYWGEPIPIYYKDGLPYSLPESELPLVLPEVDKYLPTEDGEPPLARAKGWVYKPLPNRNHQSELLRNNDGGGVPLPNGEGLGVGSLQDRATVRFFNESKTSNWQTTSAEKWKKIKETARNLRKNQTDAEEILWQHLRGKQLGYKIRRQQVIESFIVDFVSLDKKIVMEVDGGKHIDAEIQQYDEFRTEVLNHLGFKVIRFRNEEVELKIGDVLKKIKQNLEEPHPQPLPEGEGSFPLETNTMPGWAGSSWYFFRYMDSQKDKEFASKEALNYWQEVDLYLGGSEHATGHLLYSRFWTKFLYDLGYVNVKEYAKKLMNQGMIQGRSNFLYRIATPPSEEEGVGVRFVSYGLKNQYETTPIHVDVNIVENDILDIEKFKNSRDEYRNAQFILENGAYICGFEVEKMSKSKHNVVNPDDVVEKYGADTLRLYEMFLGPLEMSKPWNTNSINGVSRFLRNVWKLFYDENGNWLVTDETPTDKELKTLHKTIKKVEEDIERFSFNTSVSTFMVCVNELSDLKCHKKAILKELLIILAPYAPHIAEALNLQFGYNGKFNFQSDEIPKNYEGIDKLRLKWPVLQEKYLIENSFEYPISINGKVRHKMVFPLDATQQVIEDEAIASAEIQKWLEGKAPKKVIVVPGKIINVVL